MILTIIALIVSILSLFINIYLTVKDNKRWNEYYNRAKPIREDIIIENKYDKPIFLNPKSE